MKIVHWITSDIWRGAETLFKDCCVAMSERGHTILAVVPQKSVLHQKLMNHSDTVNLVVLRKHRRKIRWWEIRKFKRILIEFDPDVFVLHGELTVRFFEKKLNFPASRRWPIVMFVPFPLHGKTTSGIVDAIIPHTKSQASVEYHIDLVDPKFTDVVPVFSRFVPVDHVERISQIRNIIAVGSLVPEKGFNYLIDAMHKLIIEDYDLNLSIVGIGSEMENLVRQRDRLNLGSVVHFIGESDQIDKLMKKADLFVLSSVKEPFGIVLLEAMATGLPIVATKTNGPREIFFSESSVILVDSESASALSEGIRFAIEDLDATYQRACTALDLYKDRYTADVVIPKFIEVFQHCIKQRSNSLTNW